MKFTLESAKDVEALHDLFQEPGWAVLGAWLKSQAKEVLDVRNVPLEGDPAVNLGVAKGQAEVLTALEALPLMVSDFMHALAAQGGQK